MTITIPTLDESIERMKQEIIDDIKAGRVPADCPSFSALHDYVDANCAVLLKMYRGRLKAFVKLGYDVRLPGSVIGVKSHPQPNLFED